MVISDVWEKEIQYKTLLCSQMTDEEITKCKTLFDNHYGKWGKEKTGKEGQAISFPRRMYEGYRNENNIYVALAVYRNDIIGQAFYLKDVFGENKDEIVSWVLQLVVHEKFRKHGIAKTLLYSIWGFSNNYAWGLATSNAITVKTLEKATFRKVDPKEIIKHKSCALFVRDMIPFLKGAHTIISEDQSVVDSKFLIDRDIVEENRKAYLDEWKLGTLPVGYEWFAFTFSDQDFNITEEDYDEIFTNSEKIVNSAYNRMPMSSQGWQRHGDSEVSFIIDYVNNEKKTKIFKVADFGCGEGRHTHEFAKRGYEIIGIDYSENLLKTARANSVNSNETFIEADCRTVRLENNVDLAICLYDVIGTFTEKNDNKKILENIYAHLNKDGIAVISVMNLELTESIAIHKVENVRKDPQRLIELKASNTQQKSGNIFQPDYFLLETDTGIVYRKEQFENDDELAAEYVIRDKRYSKSEIEEMVKQVGFSVIESRYVRAGEWDKPLNAIHNNAKEILVIARK